MSSPGPRLAPVLAIFTLSGAAGLIYEVVWSRQLVLVFGNTTQAVSTILTGFFAGMALGSLVGGRLADRVRSPLRLYAALELVLVAVVLATPVSFRLIADVYRGSYPSLEDHAAGLALIRFALAVVALAPATVLMGATLPALTRHLTSGEHLSAAFGRLYSVNTYGAVVGTLVSGLVLIEWLGLTRTLAVGAACSGLGGLIALVLSRGQAPAVPVVAARAATAGGRPRVALLLAGASGLTSLGYQVLWTRLLSSGTGNNTYVFTLILATFLLGIALGAQVFNVARPRAAGSVGTLAAVQALIAVLALTGLAGVISHPTQVQLGEAPIPAGAIFPTVLVVVLPTAIALGFMLPAAATLLPEGGAGRQAGRLLAANTSGAIVARSSCPSSQFRCWARSTPWSSSPGSTCSPLPS